MRLGEILIDLAIITPRQLDDALQYAGYKFIPLGRALRVLKYLSEEDLSKALDAQSSIRAGLDGPTALRVLKFAIDKHRSFADAAQRPADELGLFAPVPPKMMQLITAKKDPTPGFSTVEPVPVFRPQAVPSARQEAEKSKEPSYSFEELLKTGDHFFQSNDVGRAENAYIKAYQLIEDIYGVPPSKIATVLTKLAHLYFSIDRFKEALPLYERVLELQTKIFGPGSPEATRALEDLADLFDIQDRSPETRRYLEQALASMSDQKSLNLELAGRLLKKLLSLSQRTGETSPRIRLGELALDSGLLAASDLQTSLQESRSSGKPLGAVLREKGLLDTQQVESLMFAQLLVKQGTISGPVAARAIKLCSAQQLPLRHLCEVGKWVGERDLNDEGHKQLVLQQERLLTAESNFGAESAEVATIAQEIGDLLLERKDRVTAEMLYKRALAIWQKIPNTDKNKLARMFERMGLIHCQHGKYLEAQPLLLKALEYRQQAGQGETVDAAECLWLVAKVELAQFNYATALSFLRSARAMFEKLTPESCPLELLEEMANCCGETGTTTDLEPILSKLLQAASDKGRQFEPETAQVMEQLGDLYLNTGRQSQAQAQYFSAMQIYDRTPGAQAQTQLLAKKLAQSAKA